MVVFTFRDTGPGVPKELRATLFEPFITTRAAGEGMGLGLSISRDIVEWHGGSLRLLPEGPGATFVVTLPLGRATITESGSESTPNPTPISQGSAAPHPPESGADRQPRTARPRHTRSRRVGIRSKVP